jgi:hypothetical protein
VESQDKNLTLGFWILNGIGNTVNEAIKMFKGRIQLFLECDDVQGFFCSMSRPLSAKGASVSGCSRIRWKGVLGSFS